MATVAVLLGAGASVDAGLPTSTQMTRRIASHLETTKWKYGSDPEVLNFVAGELLAARGRGGSSVFDDIDIESVLTAIELLAEREGLELTPFVHAWNPMVDAIDAGRDRPMFSFSETLSRELIGPFPRQIDDALEREIRRVTKMPDDTGRSFRHALWAIQQSLVHILADFKETSYLDPLIGLAEHQRSVAITTLNYDLTVESAAERLGVDLTTGIEHAFKAEPWLEDGGIELIKVHGSINWETSERRDGDVIPQIGVHVLAPGQNKDATPAIIFGGRNKVALRS